MSEERAVYSYLPWMRRGIATALHSVSGNPGTGQANPELPVTLGVERHRNGQVISETARVDLRLHGPGDILGIDPRQIARTEPRAFARDFEPNYLAAIEFIAPDFPWMFTPLGVSADENLPPWLALIVVRAQNGELRSYPRRPLPTIEISEPALELPDLKEIGYWAHVQALHDPSVDGVLDMDRLAGTLRDHAERVVSRIVSPRRLSPHTDYLACLVPTFKVGADRGLGLDVRAEDGLRPTWDLSSLPSTLALPVYFHWEFSTGTAGDFESLARMLKAQPAPAGVGTRPMDIADPGYGIDLAPGSSLPLESALRAPGFETSAWDEDERRRQLRKVLNTPAASDAPGELVPPLYGQFPAGRETVPEPGARPRWFGDLNLDPRRRVAAGAGAEVVRRNQESLMESAWRQVGEVGRANQLLRLAQLARSVGERFHRRLAGMNEGDQIQVTAPAHARLLVDSTTLHQRIAASSFPHEALSGTYRRRFGLRRPLSGSGEAEAARSSTRTLETESTGEPASASVPDGAVTMAKVRTMAPSSNLPPLFTERFGFWIAISASVGIVSLTLLITVIVWNHQLPTVLEGALAALVLTAFGAWLRLRKHRSLSRVQERLQPESLAAARVLESNPRPSFQVVESDSPFVPRRSGNGADSPSAKRFREAAARQLEALSERPAVSKERPALDLAETAQLLRTLLSPSKTIPARVRARLRMAHAQWAPHDPIEPIRAAPEFREAMYRPLAELSPHHLVAGVDRIPPNSVTLLETNSSFVEAYLIGLNHEMGRELLWREFPTEQRATFFRQFWDPAPALSPRAPAGTRDASKDIPPIHTWPSLSRLGEHTRTGEGNLVLLIRGELIRRYPNTVVSLVRAEWTDEEAVSAGSRGVRVTGGRYRRPVRIRGEADARWPVFTGSLPIDITFLGFDLSIEEARGEVDSQGNPVAGGDPGWFLVLREPPTEARFGLDEGDGGDLPDKIDDLTWGHVLPEGAGHIQIDREELRNLEFQAPTAHWGVNSAHMACLLLQQPVVVAIHADDMIGTATP